MWKKYSDKTAQKIGISVTTHTRTVIYGRNVLNKSVSYLHPDIGKGTKSGFNC
jgi:hypothetical protein